MQTAELQTLFDYNYWANERILQAAANVSDAQFVAPAVQSHASLRGTLVHTLTAEWMWRVRCQEGLSPAVHLSEEDFPTLGALRSRWEMEEDTMRTYLAGLEDDAPARVVEYVTTGGTAYAQPLWQILLHLVNHGTQTRSEAAMLLTEYGHSPGDLDLILFLRQQQQ